MKSSKRTFLQTTADLVVNTRHTGKVDTVNFQGEIPHFFISPNDAFFLRKDEFFQKLLDNVNKSDEGDAEDKDRKSSEGAVTTGGGGAELPDPSLGSMLSQSSGNLLDGVKSNPEGNVSTNIERSEKKFGGSTFNIKRHKVTDLATYQDQLNQSLSPAAKKGLGDSNVLRKAASITLEQVNTHVLFGGNL